MRKMMKFMAALIVMMLILSASVSAAQSENKQGDNNGNSAGGNVLIAQNSDKSSGQPDDSQVKGNQDNSPGLSIANNSANNSQLQLQSNILKRTELKEKIRIHQGNFSLEYSNLSVNEQNKLKNQNQVRLAVQALIMTDGVDGIGQQISEIAREFNNSVKTTYSAEEKIKNRNVVMNILFGGDNSSASEILQNVELNQNRIENLHQYINQSDCDEELRLLLLEQVRTLEEEQNRLSLIAQEEQKNKGLFGGFFA